MQTLMISQRFYKKLLKPEDAEILKLYGYNNAEEFFKSVIKKLNVAYSFLNIDNFDFMPREKRSTCFMYNGYIEGGVLGYDEVLVSFSDVSVGKQGNVVITEQLMPMLAPRINKDSDFMLNSNIKRIFVLSSHITSALNSKQNRIPSRASSSIQMLVKCLNSMNFDVIEQIHIINLSADARFSALQELVDGMNYFNNKNQANRQHEYITFDGKTIKGTFGIKPNGEKPNGEEQKYFAFRFLTALMLNCEYKYDLTQALEETSGIQIRALAKMAEYINTSEYTLKTPTDPMTAEITTDLSNSAMSDTTRPITYLADAKGTMRFATNSAIRHKKIATSHYTCTCHDSVHIYFTAERTNENYVEGHHLIPMREQKMFLADKHINLDVIQNIAPLCPHCHKKIHLGNNTARKEIAKLLFKQSQTELKIIDPTIDEATFLQFYNII